MDATRLQACTIVRKKGGSICYLDKTPGSQWQHCERWITADYLEVGQKYKRNWQLKIEMINDGHKKQASCLLLSKIFNNGRIMQQVTIVGPVKFIAWHGIQWQIIRIFCRESEVSG